MCHFYANCVSFTYFSIITPNYVSALINLHFIYNVNLLYCRHKNVYYKLKIFLKK